MDSGGEGEFVAACAGDYPKGARGAIYVGRGGAKEVEGGKV